MTIYTFMAHSFEEGMEKKKIVKQRWKINKPLNMELYGIGILHWHQCITLSVVLHLSVSRV